MSKEKTKLEHNIIHSKTLPPGGQHYRAYVGPPQQYDFMGATQFRLLTTLGLREENYVVDLGYGSLRSGKYLLQYLLPGRYTGIEPNSHLWLEAIAQEVGRDVIAIKMPVMSADQSLEMKDVSPESADFIIAQSIYSHTGEDLLAASLAAAAGKLSLHGQFVFTSILAKDPGFDRMERGEMVQGWIYPRCVGYNEDTITRICAKAGLHVQQLPWYHPRQTWFRAVRDRTLTLSPELLVEMGTGRPLFDARFARSDKL